MLLLQQVSTSIQNLSFHQRAKQQLQRHSHRSPVKPAEGLTPQCGSNFGFCSGENLQPVSSFKALNVPGCLEGIFHGQFGSRKCHRSGCLCKQLVMVLARGETCVVYVHTNVSTHYVQNRLYTYVIPINVHINKYLRNLHVHRNHQSSLSLKCNEACRQHNYSCQISFSYS